jgi:nickel transport protein
MAIWIITVLCCWAGSAEAHKVNLFAYVEGDRIIVEGYFSGNAKAMNCVVDVLDKEGKKLLEGKTDTQGMYSFKIAELPPITGDLKIVLHADQGHMTDFTLPAADLPASAKAGASASSSEGTPEPIKSQPAKVDAPKSAETVTAAQPVGPDAAALKKILDEALDAKMEPLVKMLGNQQKLLLEQKERGPSMVEIFGGIGWILGIFGTAAYFAGRNRAEKR